MRQRLYRKQIIISGRNFKWKQPLTFSIKADTKETTNFMLQKQAWPTLERSNGAKTFFLEENLY